VISLREKGVNLMAIRVTEVSLRIMAPWLRKPNNNNHHHHYNKNNNNNDNNNNNINYK